MLVTIAVWRFWAVGAGRHKYTDKARLSSCTSQSSSYQ